MGTPEERLERLREAIAFEADEAACEACLGRLDELVNAQLDGVDVRTAFPETALHLDRCVQCSATFARIYDVELAARTHRVPDVAPARPPELWFIDGRTNALRQQLRDAFRRVRGRLRVDFSPVLLALLEPPVTPAVVVRGAPDNRSGEELARLSLEEAGELDLPVGLRVHRDTDAPSMCIVEVEVRAPGRDWPDLAGVPVTISGPVWRRDALTDAFGIAVVRGVLVADLAQAVLEVSLPSDQ